MSRFRLTRRLIALLATQLTAASVLALLLGGPAQAVTIDRVAVGDPDITRSRSSGNDTDGTIAGRSDGVRNRARMTGEGRFLNDPSVRYHFRLWCAPDGRRNRLWIRWGEGNLFVLEQVTDALCSDDPALDPGRPPANFDSHSGAGRGVLNREGEAQVRWTFTDGGEPGERDGAELLVTDSAGNVLLDISGPPKRHHQARGQALLPLEPGVDPENLLHTVVSDGQGLPLTYVQRALPTTAFTVEPRDPEPKPGLVPGDPPAKIHPDLDRMITEGDPDDRVEAVVSLSDDVVLPRFPDAFRGVDCGSRLLAEAAELQAAIIESLLQARTRSTQTFLNRFREGDHNIEVVEQFWLANAFLADLRLGDVVPLASLDDLRFIEPDVQELDPPSDDGDPSNDPAAARAYIRSDPFYYQSGMRGGCIGLIDSGVDSNHTLFSNPNANIWIQGDCVHGGPSCLDSNQPGFDLSDVFNHGTGTAAILTGNANLGSRFRGVTDIRVDSWKVFGIGNENNGQTISSAAIRAFQQALVNFDRVLVAELQVQAPENSALAMAANHAFDAGAVVVAATGNCAVRDDCTQAVGTPRPGTVRAPANAHRVIGVGAFNVASHVTGDYQGYGPTNDLRYKPDIQAPTDTETASQCDEYWVYGVRQCMGGYSTTALLRHGGTSGSTPFAGGAAALIRNWHRKFNTFDPGQTYARLIVSGQQPYPYTERGGAGHLQLPACAASHWGKVSISPSVGGSSTVNVPIPVFGGMEDLDAAIWWPMSPVQAATDLDLYLIDPNGVERAKGFDEHSVFERIRVTGSLTPGTWTLKITGYTLLSSQTIYWTADVHGCFPLVVHTGGIPVGPPVASQRASHER